MSGTTREGFKVKLLTPGPGHYTGSQNSNKVLSDALLKQTRAAIPFNTRQSRAVGSGKNKSADPGPGHYNAYRGIQISRKTSQFKESDVYAQSEGFTPAVFGSKATRSTQKQSDETPGPGAYTHSDFVQKSLLSHTRSAEFIKVTQERQVSQQSMISEHASLALSFQNKTLDNCKPVDSKHGTSFSQFSAKQQRASDYTRATGKTIGFDASCQRFTIDQIFPGSSLKFDVPGPGHYDLHSDRPKPKASRSR